MGSSGILGRVSHHSKASVIDWVGSEIFFFFFLEIAPLIAKLSSKQQEEAKAAS